MLKAGEADIALTVEVPDVDDPEITASTHLPARRPDVPGAAAGHPLANRRRVRLEDLAGEPWILGSRRRPARTRAIVLRACTLAGFEPDIAFNTTTTTRSRASSPPASASR